MLADIRARINRITKQVGPEHKSITIISTCDTLTIEGHDAPMHQYDTNTIWCTMQRLRKRINVFATKTLTYSTGTTTPHNEHDDSSDSEDEREESNPTAENDSECPESKFSFQVNHTEMELSSAASTPLRDAWKASKQHQTKCYKMEGGQKPKHHEQTQWHRAKC